MYDYRDFEFDVDKMLGPVDRVLASLKRTRQPGWKNAFSDIQKAVDKLESKSKDLTKKKSVVDEKSFDGKIKALDELSKLCKSTEDAIQKLMTSPVDTDPKSRGAVQVNEVPKGKKNATVADLPIVGDQLRDLKAAIEKTSQQIKKDKDDFTNSFDDSSKPDAIDVKIPKSMTNMVELCDRKGSITLPDEQTFEATITIEGIAKATLVREKSNVLKEILGEVGRELEKEKRKIAAAFKTWNSKFEQVERNLTEENKKKGLELFGLINKHFKDELPKFIKDSLDTAARNALNDALSKSKEDLSKAKITVAATYKGFAEFEVTFPEKPGGLGKSFKDADSANSTLTEQATEIGEGYKELQDSSRKLQAAVAKGGKSAESKELQKAVSRLQGGVDEADAARQSLLDQLGPVNKKLRENKDTLKEDKEIKYDELSKGLNAALRELKDGKVSSTLKGLTETINAAKKLVTAFDELYGKGGGDAPDQKKADTFKQDFDKFVKGLTLKPQSFKEDLKISLDLALLKTVSEKFK